MSGMSLPAAATPTEWAQAITTLLITHHPDPVAVVARVSRHGGWGGVGASHVQGVVLTWVGQDDYGWEATPGPLRVWSDHGWVVEYDGTRFVAVADVLSPPGAVPTWCQDGSTARGPVPASTVQPGQEITEIDTPAGPWHRVAGITPHSLAVFVDPDDPAAGTLTLPIGPTDGVLVRNSHNAHDAGEEHGDRRHGGSGGGGRGGVAGPDPCPCPCPCGCGRDTARDDLSGHADQCPTDCALGYVAVRVVNTYTCGRVSGWVQVLPAPAENLDNVDDVDGWFAEHVVHGDGHTCGATEHAVYEMTVVSALGRPALVGHTHVSEG